MATVLKPKRPVNAALNMNDSNLAIVATEDDDMTVEKYLEKKFEVMLQDFKNHTQSMVLKLREEYKSTAAQIQDITNANKSSIGRLFYFLVYYLFDFVGFFFRK
jgi:predicted patatin/cPLA2 family phospholipase